MTEPTNPAPSTATYTEQDHENKRHHLSLIQATIIRMAANAFLLKGWAVTLVVGLFALASKDSSHELVLVAAIPTLGFWFLNAYYLNQERRFRCLYDHVRVLPPTAIDFSLDTRAAVSGDIGVGAALLSVTLRTFYGVMLLAIIAADILLNRIDVVKAFCSRF